VRSCRDEVEITLPYLLHLVTFIWLFSMENELAVAFEDML
jgi:hypothetical protein